jgi:hypothetical protein
MKRNISPSINNRRIQADEKWEQLVLLYRSSQNLSHNVGSRTRDRSKVKPGLVRKDIRSSGSDNLQQAKEDEFTNSDQPRGKTKKSSLLHLTSTK